MAAEDVSPTLREVALANAIQNMQEGRMGVADDIRFATQALRLKYTEGVGNVDQEHAVATRHITGPHPYYGAPTGSTP